MRSLVADHPYSPSPHRLIRDAERLDGLDIPNSLLSCEAEVLLHYKAQCLSTPPSYPGMLEAASYAGIYISVLNEQQRARINCLLLNAGAVVDKTLLGRMSRD